MATGETPDEPGSWLRQNPFFAAFLLVLMVGGPLALNAARDDYLRRAYTEMQDAWQQRLELGGLPVPWLPPSDVPPPPLQGPLRRLGLQPRQAALEAWRALQAGAVAASTSLAPAQGESPLAPALRACEHLRAAVADVGTDAAGRAARVARARVETAQAPAELQPTLEVAALLVAGEDGAAQAAAERDLTGTPPAAAVAALRALRDEARRRRLGAALGGPPDPALLADVARWAGDGLGAVGPALAAGGADLAARLVPGPGDLAAASALVDLFAAVAGRGPAAAPELGPAWQATRERVGAVVAARLAAFDDDPRAAFDAAARLGRFDPEADVPPAAYAGWRAHLQTVVNDPERLRRVAARFLELGHLPPAVEAIVAAAGLEPSPAPAPGVGVGGAGVGTGGAGGVGEALADALVVTLAAEAAAPGSPPAAGAPAAVAARLRPLDAALAGRGDPAARRARAQGAALLGRALARAGAGADADAAYARAGEDGYEPRQRLLALRADAARRLGGPAGLAAAVALDRERVALLDGLATTLAAGLAPEAAAAWEVRGWPTDARELALARVEARADLAAALAAQGDAAAAVVIAAEAVPLHPDHAARAGLAHARALQAAGRRADARAAVEAALARVRPEDRALRRELEGLRATLAGE